LAELTRTAKKMAEQLKGAVRRERNHASIAAGFGI
jgi:hypothetical protein